MVLALHQFSARHHFENRWHIESQKSTKFLTDTNGIRIDENVLIRDILKSGDSVIIGLLPADSVLHENTAQFYRNYQ